MIIGSLEHFLRDRIAEIVVEMEEESKQNPVSYHNSYAEGYNQGYLDALESIETSRKEGLIK